MFSNFIYYIIVLLIYSSYIPPDVTFFSITKSILFSLLLIFIFQITCSIFFKRIGKSCNLSSFPNPSSSPPQSLWMIEENIDKLIQRFSISAIILFAIYIYILNLPGFFSYFSIFKAIPSLQAILFIGLFILHLAIIWYYAFDIQEKYLNVSITKRTYIFSNIMFSIPALIPWFLLTIISNLISLLPFNGIKLFFEGTIGEILYLLAFTICITIFGPLFIKKFWRCKSLEKGTDRQRIEKLCLLTGVKYKDILKWELFAGTMVTAGVMGVMGRFRYILVTPALLYTLNDTEIDAVIAHEIGHIKKKHLIFYMFFFLSYIVVVYSIFTPLIYLIFYSTPVIWIVNNFGVNHDFVATVILCTIIITIFIIFFRFIFGFFMRNFERQADAFVYSVLNNAKPLISTFYKLAGSSKQALNKPNWHHFSIKERIGYLEKCENNKIWIFKQNRKIKLIICFYALGVIFAGYAGFELNFGESKKSINQYFSEKVLLYKIAEHPQKTIIYEKQ